MGSQLPELTDCVTLSKLPALPVSRFLEVKTSLTAAGFGEVRKPANRKYFEACLARRELSVHIGSYGVGWPLPCLVPG